MSLMTRMRNWFTGKPDEHISTLRMVNEYGDGMVTWNGKPFKSDIIRACIRPAVHAAGKMEGIHIRERDDEVVYRPDPYMQFLLEEPNPYMTGQMLQEKMVNQLLLNGNAFAYIQRDENDVPVQIYPISASYVEAVYDQTGRLYLKFTYLNGNTNIIPYSDILHLRRDFYDREVFGSSPIDALKDLMGTLNALDQGIGKAIKNSGTVRWLLKLNSSTRPEDVKKYVKSFADTYLSVDSDTMGVAGTSANAEAEQIKPYDIMPNKALLDSQRARVYSFFNTNEAIVTSNYTDDQWNAYYEAEIAPLSVQFSREWTRKLFTRRERAFGNRIEFQGMSLQYASLNTKLNLQAMVDRGAMNTNEWRKTMYLPRTEDGDTYIRRLDTQPVNSDRGEVKMHADTSESSRTDRTE